MNAGNPKAMPRNTTNREVSVMKLIAVFAASVFVFAACSSGSEQEVTPATGPSPTTTEIPAVAAPAPTPTIAEAVPTSTATSEPTATTPAPTTEASAAIEEVLANQVRGYFDARATANAAPAPNPDDPRLAEYASGEELAAVTANTAIRRDAGQAIRPGEAGLADIGVGFVSAAASSASVAACAVDDGVIYDLDTGEAVDDAVVTHNYQIDLELIEGAWKVSRIVRIQQWEGVAGCALATADYPF